MDVVEVGESSCSYSLLGLTTTLDEVQPPSVGVVGFRTKVVPYGRLGDPRGSRGPNGPETDVPDRGT